MLEAQGMTWVCTIYRFSKSQFPNELFIDLAPEKTARPRPQLQAEWTLWADRQELAKREVTYVWNTTQPPGDGSSLVSPAWFAKKFVSRGFIHITPFLLNTQNGAYNPKAAYACDANYLKPDWDSLGAHEAYSEYQSFVFLKNRNGPYREGFCLHEFVLPIGREDLAKVTDMKLLLEWQGLQHLTPETVP
jgi:hypothetical protein